MSTTCLTQQLQGKPVISVTNGEIVGKVLDVLIDPEALRVAAAVTSKGKMLGRQREIDVIPGDEVQVWGQDAVLVNRPDVIVKDSELPGRETWLSVADQVKGHAVIGTDGRRIGQLNDVVIDVNGQFVGYDLVQPFVPGGDKAQAIKQIPAETTSVLGQDVLIVVLSQLEQQLLIEEPLQVDEALEVDVQEVDEALDVEEQLRAEDLIVDEEAPPSEEMSEGDGDQQD
jgi:uncharacterized protein YrrD